MALYNRKPDKLRQLFAMAHAAGQTYEEIAKILKVNRRTLYNWRSELDLPRRSDGRRGN